MCDMSQVTAPCHCVCYHLSWDCNLSTCVYVCIFTVAKSSGLRWCVDSPVSVWKYELFGWRASPDKKCFNSHGHAQWLQAYSQLVSSCLSHACSCVKGEKKRSNHLVIKFDSLLTKGEAPWNWLYHTKYTTFCMSALASAGIQGTRWPLHPLNSCRHGNCHVALQQPN